MWRYLLPGLLMIAAIIAIMAGSFDPLISRSILAAIAPKPTPQRETTQREEAKLGEVQAELARTTREAEQARQQREALSLQLSELRTEITRTTLEAEQARQTLAKLQDDVRREQARPVEPPAQPAPPVKQVKPRPPVAEREAQARRRQRTEEPPPEPVSVAPRQRLLDARLAVMEGRIPDAARLLQEAQIQLVFRPVSPSQDDPGPASYAAQRIARAISMLQVADLPRAIENIDLAVRESPQ